MVDQMTPQRLSEIKDVVATTPDPTLRDVTRELVEEVERRQRSDMWSAVGAR